MSKLLPTLFLVLIIGLIGGVVGLSFMDVPVATEKVEHSVTYEEFKANNNS